MIELEKKIKEVSERTEHKEIFVDVKGEFYNFLSQNGCIEKLEKNYKLQIHLQKSLESSKKMFLCQFYQR